MEDYTPWRQFMAWSGFVFWIVVAILGFQFHSQIMEMVQNQGKTVWITGDKVEYTYVFEHHCVDYGEGIICE